MGIVNVYTRFFPDENKMSQKRHLQSDNISTTIESCARF